MSNEQSSHTTSVQNKQPYVGASGARMVQQRSPEVHKSYSGLIKTIVIIILSLVSVTFIGLFIWIFLQYDEIQTDVDGQISKAVAEAKDEQSSKDEAEFLEREKYPYRVFSGPIDYGELNFEYPKTWSLYISKDASNGGDYEAYMNPVEIQPISNTTVNALRIQILDKSFDDVVKQYQTYLNNKNRPLSIDAVTVNGNNANLYSGMIPGTEFVGYILIFKIRDKTAILRTDSALFKDDFDKLIQTIRFNA